MAVSSFGADETRQAWADLTAEDDDSRLDPGPVPEITGRGGGLPSRLPVEEIAVACVGTALLASSTLQRLRGGGDLRVSLDRDHVNAAVRSEAYFRRGALPAPASFAPLSRFWPTADGWVRTHANYPWHRAALLRAIGTRGTGDGVDTAKVERVAAALAQRNAIEIEELVFAQGGVAACVRKPETWRDHPQAQAVATEPLVGHELVGPADPRSRPAAPLPADDIRVLDLTRVIAGPICTRFLGALGADVLRLDPPRHPDMARGTPADTLLGKRSAFLDLGSTGGLSTLHRLLDEADVVVHGYRPGSLRHFGLGAEDLARRHPGLVIVQLDAWGHTGPWSHRRGFDSIVQAAAGIAVAESVDGTTPGALPCQLLDHGAGYLAAAAVLDGLRRQMQDGGTVLRSVSLARTAAWLTGRSRERGAPPAPIPALDSPQAETTASWAVQLDGPDGQVTAIAPQGASAAVAWSGRRRRRATEPTDWPGAAGSCSADRVADWAPTAGPPGRHQRSDPVGRFWYLRRVLTRRRYQNRWRATRRWPPTGRWRATRRRRVAPGHSSRARRSSRVSRRTTNRLTPSRTNTTGGLGTLL